MSVVEVRGEVATPITVRSDNVGDGLSNTTGTDSRAFCVAAYASDRPRVTCRPKQVVFLRRRRSRT